MKLFCEENAKIETTRLIIIVILITLIGIFIPVNGFVSFVFKTDSEAIRLFASAAVRFIFSGVFLVLAFRLGFRLIGKQKLKNMIIIIPALVVAINNFPFITFFSGEAVITMPVLQIVATVVFCISVGCFEELSFRAIILPLVSIKLEGKKHEVFWSVVISSALFGAIHLVNLIGNFSPVVIMQIGYSFLIGALCAIVYLKTQNIIFPIVIHAVFDIAGALCSGEYWNGYSIALTAIVGVIALVIMIFYLKSLSKNKTKKAENNSLGE